MKSSPNRTAPEFSRRDLTRAVLAWLALADAQGLATDVPTGVHRHRADVAAFWSRSVRQADAGRTLQPCRTAIVECRLTRAECWPDCHNAQELSPQLRQLRRDQRRRQTRIRTREPELRGSDMLFDEYADWQYERSRDTGYHDVCRRLEQLEGVLYRGTRFESLRQAGVADRCYLAVPAELVAPHELAAGWGLLWIDRQRRVTEVTPATDLACADAQRLHLVQTIAAAAQDSVRFAHGIARDGDRAVFRPPPPRRSGGHVSKRAFRRAVLRPLASALLWLGLRVVERLPRRCAAG